MVPRLVPDEPENRPESKLDAITALLSELSPEDRAALAARLTGVEGKE